MWHGHDDAELAVEKSILKFVAMQLARYDLWQVFTHQWRTQTNVKETATVWRPIVAYTHKYVQLLL